MEKTYRRILKYKKFIIAAFLVGCVFCVFLQAQVKVNYDMDDYLPNNSPSTKAIGVMEEEFEGGIPNARVMISNVSVAEALEYKGKLMEIDGVSDVVWLNDSINITEPLVSQDTKSIEMYYKDGDALYTVTIDRDMREQGVKAIRELIGEDNSMSGIAVDTAVATESTVDEIAKIVRIAIPLVFLILLITTTSWVEPAIILLSIGVAVLLNVGTNIVFGTVSFITNGAGNILQLAVSLDYSVFLLHRFGEYRKQGLDPEKAMVEALCKSTNSILSSGLTTIIAFAALILMRFKIGPDLGLALAKGICFSLLTVFIFLPVLVLKTYPLLEKTSHNPFLPEFKKFGGFVGKMMIPMVIIFLIVIAPAYLAQKQDNFYYGSEHIFDTTTQIGQDAEKINNKFGKSNTLVLLVPKGDVVKETRICGLLKAMPEIGDVISYVEKAGPEIPYEYLDVETLNKLYSENYSRIVVTVNTNYEGEEAFHVVERTRQIAQNYYPDTWYLAGKSASTYDLMDTIIEDNLRVNLMAIAAVFVVLLLVFRSLLIPFILVLAIETAVWINMAIPYFCDATLFYLAYLVVSSIQLGSTVDYAILMNSRYLEFRSELEKKDAIRRTVSTVTVSILTSGSALTVAGFLIGYITSHGILQQLGILIGRGAILSMAIVFFVLPGLLYLLDRPIEKTTRGLKFKHKESRENEN